MCQYVHKYDMCLCVCMHICVMCPLMADVLDQIEVVRQAVRPSQTWLARLRCNITGQDWPGLPAWPVILSVNAWLCRSTPAWPSLACLGLASTIGQEWLGLGAAKRCVHIFGIYTSDMYLSYMSVPKHIHICAMQ